MSITNRLAQGRDLADESSTLLARNFKFFLYCYAPLIIFATSMPYLSLAHPLWKLLAIALKTICSLLLIYQLTKAQNLVTASVSSLFLNGGAAILFFYLFSIAGSYVDNASINNFSYRLIVVMSLLALVRMATCAILPALVVGMCSIFRGVWQSTVLLYTKFWEIIGGGGFIWLVGGSVASLLQFPAEFVANHTTIVALQVVIHVYQAVINEAFSALFTVFVYHLYVKTYLSNVNAQ